MAGLQMNLNINIDIRSQYVICEALNNSLLHEISLIESTPFEKLKKDPIPVIKGMGIIRIFSEALEALLTPVAESIADGDKNDFSESETIFIFGVQEISDKFTESSNIFRGLIQELADKQEDNSHQNSLGDLLDDFNIKMTEK